MFTLPSLYDLFRDAVIIGILIYWLRRYLPPGRPASSQSAAPDTGDEADLIWVGAEEIAEHYNQIKLRRDHLVWAILSTPGAELDELLRQFPVDRLQARVQVAAVISGFPKQFLWRVYHRRLWLSPELRQTFDQARGEATQARALQVSPLHVLLALVAPDPAPTTEEAALAQKLLAELGLTRATLADAIIRQNAKAATDNPDPTH